MEEHEFRQLLDLFPIVRSRNYRVDSELSRESTSHSTLDEVTDWQNAWGEVDRKEGKFQGIDNEDPFWEKLRSTAERKVGAAEAERFCKAFQMVHKKLVYEELSSDAARRLLNSMTSSAG
ncbi:octanoyltransferase [Tasmannia lanceolata]|uniref:octanoyltransferase n=1 Tax=Tasmannia lanceolata TaxID=3420 RepID=UPI0040647EB5